MRGELIMNYVIKNGKIVEVQVTIGENELINNLAMKHNVHKRRIISTIIRNGSGTNEVIDEFKIELLLCDAKEVV
jgi:hypothetical protein